MTTWDANQIVDHLLTELSFDLMADPGGSFRDQLRTRLQEHLDQAVEDFKAQYRYESQEPIRGLPTERDAARWILDGLVESGLVGSKDSEAVPAAFNRDRLANSRLLKIGADHINGSGDSRPGPRLLVKLLDDGTGTERHPWGNPDHRDDLTWELPNPAELLITVGDYKLSLVGNRTGIFWGEERGSDHGRPHAFRCVAIDTTIGEIKGGQIFVKVVENGPASIVQTASENHASESWLIGSVEERADSWDAVYQIRPDNSVHLRIGQYDSFYSQDPTTGIWFGTELGHGGNNHHVLLARVDTSICR